MDPYFQLDEGAMCNKTPLHKANDLYFLLVFPPVTYATHSRGISLCVVRELPSFTDTAFLSYSP